MKKDVIPPKLPLRFFRWYCHPKLLKHIEGDLMELYNERVNQVGKRKADAKFIVDVLLLFRPGIIRSFGVKHLNNHNMFRNYIRVGWRNLVRSKGYSAINIAGLAAGMGVTMLIGMWLYDEITFNRCHTNYERIAQVYQHRTFTGEINTTSETPIPLGTELRTTYTNDFKRVVRAWWNGNHILSIDETRSIKVGNFMDPEALAMFSFTMLKGDHRSLAEPASIILSEPAAIAFFGDDDPINKILRIDNVVDAKVTGVFKPFPSNSRFHELQFVSTWDLWVSANEWLKMEENNWNSGINVFVELHPNTFFDALSARVSNLKSDRISREQAEQENPLLFLQPMSRWHLYTQWKDGRESGGRIQYVWLFGIIGVFVLLLACINFMNLSTAQSERRSREVGIRKSIGSVRGQLVNQFLTESFLVVLFSFVLALSLVIAVIPWFNELADKNMD
ncbi:MAG TPA: permease prefix domain 2-containing transporter, partial [Cyclobacteriaceae bacterium]|nr:permease prefix domain 2-containing transporter [Cyclobacteriaceae bacterium]